MAATSSSVLMNVATSYPSAFSSAFSIARSSFVVAVDRDSNTTLPLAMNVSTRP